MRHKKAPLKPSSLVGDMKLAVINHMTRRNSSLEFYVVQNIWEERKQSEA